MIETLSSKAPPELSALAVAFAAVAGPASAESTVSLGGRIDLGPQFIDGGMTSSKRIDSGAYTASRLVFQAKEDLGGGLGALVYMETRFNADTGAPQSNSKFFNAGSYVGLGSADWGTVTLGRQYVPIFWSFLFADDAGPLRLHGYSAVQSVQRSNFARIAADASPIRQAGSLDSIADGVYTLDITSAFEDNLVVYKTPSFGGLTAMFAAGFPEGYPSGAGKIRGGNLEYSQGAFYGSVAYNEKEGRVPAGGAIPQRVREAVASAMYAFTPQFKLWGNVHPWEFTGPARSRLEGRDWMLGASYRFRAGMLWINYARKAIDDCVECNSRGFGVGYHRPLSRRTELYASYGRVGNDANSGNRLNGFAPGLLGQRVRGVALGMVHLF